jgi:hypothetical protein
MTYKESTDAPDATYLFGSELAAIVRTKDYAADSGRSVVT